MNETILSNIIMCRIHLFLVHVAVHGYTRARFLLFYVVQCNNR